MKKIQLVFLLLVAYQNIVAHNIEQCRAVVQLTIGCINHHSAEELSPHLSSEFTMAGQNGEVAKMVLRQLLSQLGETVLSHKELSENKEGTELRLSYKIEYQTLGEKEATFVFDSNNLLKELHLFKMEVKTMNSDSKIIKSDYEVVEIPFTMANNLIAVDVLLNGVKRKFILDSGAPRVILNAHYVSKKDSASRSISSSQGVNGSISGMDITEVNQLDFGGIQLNNQKVVTIDLSHLEEELGIDCYGLIGYEMIKDYDIIFDYKNQALTLIAPEHFEKYKREKLSTNALKTVPFDLEGHIPVIKVKIGNKVLNLGIDSGAESNLIDDDLFTSLRKDFHSIKKEELIGADNNAKEVQKAKVNKMEIGEYTFKNSPTLFSDISHLNKGYKVQLDGLIGYPILSKHKVLLSFNRTEIIFIE